MFPKSPHAFSRLIATAVTVLVISGLLAACQPAATTQAPTPEETAPNYAGRRIAFIESYHEGYAWSDGVVQGVYSVLDAYDVELLTVHLDTKRNGSPEFGEDAGRAAQEQLAAFEPDVIIASDDNAQKYVIVPYYMDSDIPVVFCGVNWDASMYGYPTEHITGMVEVDLVAELLERLRSFASGPKLAYVGIDAETEVKSVNTYKERFFDEGVDIHLVSTTAEYMDAFLEAQQVADFVMVGNNAGADSWDAATMERFFAENTRVPTGTIYSWMAPYALITVASSPAEQGEWAAQAALKILDGTPISEIPVATNQRGDIIANLDIAENLNVTFPPSLLRNAEVIGLEEGTDD